MRILAFAVAILLVASIAAKTSYSQSLLRPSDSKTVAKGSLIYKQHCSSCHGKNLEGAPSWRLRLPNGKLPAPPHDESGHTWHHSDKILFSLTKQGPTKIIGGDYKSDMPGFDKILTDDQIIEVLSYIKSRWPKEIQKRHNLLNERSR